jgi:gas vesicle protein
MFNRHKHSITDEPAKVAGIAAVGAAIGAGVTMVLTPRSGKQLRSGLRRRATNLKKDAQQKLEQSVQEVGDTAEDSKRAASKAAAKTKAAAAKTSDDAKVVKKRTTQAASAAKKDTK